MKGLRIIFGFMLMGLLLGLSLPISAQVASDAPMTVEPKATQGDTIRMTWPVSSNTDKGFSFYGEEGATYKVDWGDGRTDSYTGQGSDISVKCEHRYFSAGIYKVLLFGVGTVGK